MRINSIGQNYLRSTNTVTQPTSSSIQQKNLGREFLVTQSSIAFQGRVVKYSKPVITSDAGKAIYSKVSRVVTTFPNGCKTVKPFLFQVDGKKYAMTLDKQNMDKVRLVLKDSIETVDDWSHPINSQSTMTCFFDKNGVMTAGELIQRKNENYSKRLCYSTEGSSKRRIKMEGMLFRPSHGEDKDVWNIVKDLSTFDSIQQIDFKKSLQDIPFSELFFELTKNKSTIL